MESKTIVVLGTMDTKGREMEFIRAEIRFRGHRAILVDAGVVGSAMGTPDVPREQVARAGGVPLEELLVNPVRERAAPVMAAGATAIITGLAASKEADGIIALGGTQGTTLCTTVMRALPYGFPKVMLSTIASGNTAPFVDISDITMMFSVTDIMGLNPVSRKILSNAAGAVCGMAESTVQMETGGHHLVAVTTVGITTVGAMRAIATLEAAGYETIVFHAVGTGGRAMEALMRQGVITAVLDLATIELSNEMYHALLAGGPERLTVAGSLGLPQVIVPGSIAVLVYNEPHTIPPPYQDRPYIAHSPKITDIRLNRDEMVAVAHEMARRLQHTAGKAVFLVPRKGYDAYTTEGQLWWDPEADAAFLDVIKAERPACMPVVERDLDINDPAFATEAAETLMRLMKGA